MDDIKLQVQLDDEDLFRLRDALEVYKETVIGWNGTTKQIEDWIDAFESLISNAQAAKQAVLGIDGDHVRYYERARLVLAQ